MRLIGRIERVERELGQAAGVHVWWPADDEVDDGRVRNVRTGETIARADVDRQPGRHVVVEYVEGGVPCG